MDKTFLLKLYSNMVRIRRFEEKIEELQRTGFVMGSAHLSIGQEAVAAGACSALNENDYIISNHRGHGHCIAKGARLDKMMAELFGKTTGYCKGKGGSMHIADPERGNLGANGIVGGGIPIASGVGLSIKIRQTDQAVLCFFGDGAINQGSFHEAANFASVYKLPVIFICENNQYAVSMHCSKSSAVCPISKRATGYGMNGITIDGNDALVVHNSVSEAVKSAKEGKGPSLVECITYRWRGHSIADPRAYRTKEEEAIWREKCPLEVFKKYIFTSGIATESELVIISDEVEEELNEAVQFAKQSQSLDKKDLSDDIFAI